MAYQLKSKNGQPIKKDGAPIMGMDMIGVKIEQLDDANMTFLAVASTEDEDRDKDIIRQSGWVLTNFKKNPIIPWSHNYWEVPIAKSIRTWVDSVSKRLLIKPKFDSNDEFSRKIFHKYANGFLTSFSVGFRGLEATPRDPNDQWFGGKEFTKQELLEVSAVAVPANPNANVNLSFEEAGMVKSMLDIGYPEYFSKRKDNWLFYPIRDVGQFASPKQVPFSHDGKVIVGAYEIKATAIDEEHPEGKKEVVVGYSFDPSEFDQELAVDFAKENGEKTVKTYYYHVQFEDEKGISVEPKIEDVEITYSNDIKDIEWGDPNTVHGYSYRVYVDKSKIDALAEEKKTGEDPPAEPCVEEPPVPPEPGVPEENLDKINQSINEFSKQISAFSEMAKELGKRFESISVVMEKLVDKQEKVVHNDTKVEPDDSVLEFDDEESDQKVDDGKEDLEVIETPPENPDNKTNSDETIEIDEAELKSVGNIGELIVNGLKDSLKRQLEDVVINSGKID